MQIEHDPDEEGRPNKMSGLDVFSNLVAAAILLPLGWWLKANYGHALGVWIFSWF